MKDKTHKEGNYILTFIIWAIAIIVIWLCFFPIINYVSNCQSIAPWMRKLLESYNAVPTAYAVLGTLFTGLAFAGIIVTIMMQNYVISRSVDDEKFKIFNTIFDNFKESLALSADKASPDNYKIAYWSVLYSYVERNCDTAIITPRNVIESIETIKKSRKVWEKTMWRLSYLCFAARHLETRMNKETDLQYTNYMKSMLTDSELFTLQSLVHSIDLGVKPKGNPFYNFLEIYDGNNTFEQCIKSEISKNYEITSEQISELMKQFLIDISQENIDKLNNKLRAS